MVLNSSCSAEWQALGIELFLPFLALEQQASTQLVQLDSVDLFMLLDVFKLLFEVLNINQTRPELVNNRRFFHLSIC